MKFIAVIMGTVVVAGLGVVSASYWIGKIGGEDAVIEFERTQRQVRYDLGLTQPNQPDLEKLPQRLKERGFVQGAPVLVRIFKKEFELELWMQKNGVFERFATYPICVWSGDLGPKLREGDAQAPEGFYTVDSAALNPNSKYHRAINVGYPNAFDKANGRTGSLIMVHGSCVSIGCFAMTNAQIDEIWQLVTAALSSGQKRLQVQIYPFRLTGDALKGRESDTNIAFWRDLKTGSDLFEKSFVPPAVMACQGRYHFGGGARGSVGDAPIEARCPEAPSPRRG